MRQIFQRCNSELNQTSSLARHRRTHEAENPFPCSFRPCQAKFPTRKLLNDHEKYSHNAGPPRNKRKDSDVKEFQTYTEIKSAQITPESTPCQSPRVLMTPHLSGNTLASSVDHYGGYSRSNLGDSSSLLEMSSAPFGNTGPFMDHSSDHFNHSRNQTMSTTYHKSPEMSYDAISSALLSFQHGANSKSESFPEELSAHYGNHLSSSFPSFDRIGGMIGNPAKGQTSYNDQYSQTVLRSTDNPQVFENEGGDGGDVYFAPPNRFPRGSLRDFGNPSLANPSGRFDSNDLGIDFQNDSSTLRGEELHGLPYPRPKGRALAPPRIDTQLHHLYQQNSNLVGGYGISDDRGHFSAPATTNGQFPPTDTPYARYPFSSYPNNMPLHLMDTPVDQGNANQP